jgi:ubiquinone/menaquinone biosynthesis C-methylase UbiE
MVVSDSVFAGQLPALYDAVLGPFMFEPFAHETARRFSGYSGAVLEIAAGTGIVTRALDRMLAAPAQLLATDLNPAMLEIAARRLASPRVRWRPADALALPFAAAAFDAVVCQFGVMFYPDPVAGHREAARVLRTAGRYVLAVWDDLAGNAVAETVHRCVGERFPDDRPQFLARTPHGHHDVEKLRRDLAAAGFADVGVDTVTLDAGRLTADQLALGFCQGTPLRHEIEARDPAGLATTTAVVAKALGARFGTGPVESTIRAHVVTAVR